MVLCIYHNFVFITFAAYLCVFKPCHDLINNLLILN